MKTLLPVLGTLLAAWLFAGCSDEPDDSDGASGAGAGGASEASAAPTTASATYCAELEEFDTAFARSFGPAQTDEALGLLDELAERAATLAADAPAGLEDAWSDVEASYQRAAEDLPDQLVATDGLSGAELARARQENLSAILVAVGGGFPGKEKAPGLHENALVACGVKLG